MHTSSSRNATADNAITGVLRHTTPDASLQQQQQWGSAPAAASASLSDSGLLTSVSLIASKPTHKAVEYRLQLFTADRISAGLPAGQRVVLELLGHPAVSAAQQTGRKASAAAAAAAQQTAVPGGDASSSSSAVAAGPVLLRAELPRARGSFGRGSTEAFTVLSQSGEIGEIGAALIWHEPDGGSIGFGWCLERLEVESSFRGIRYSFSNQQNSNGWVGRGRSRAVLLTKPKISKRGDSEALQAEAAEVQRQLQGNAGLSGEDRQLLQKRLAQLQARLVAAG
jgi:hypothetical protein